MVVPNWCIRRVVGARAVTGEFPACRWVIFVVLCANFDVSVLVHYSHEDDPGGAILC